MGHILKGQVRYTLAVEDVIQQGEIPTDLQGLLPLSFTSGTTASFDEGIDANSLVYTAVAEKPDNGGSAGITYGLSGTDNTLFQMNTNTGALTINDVPDYENKQSYSLLVSANHTNFSATTQNLGLTVNNIDDTGVTFPIQTVSVAEHQSPGNSFGLLNTTDVDITGTRAVTFSLENANGDVTDGGGRVNFYSSQAGQITFTTGKTLIDRELDGSSFDITIKAVDQSNNVSYHTQTISINDATEITTQDYTNDTTVFAVLTDYPPRAGYQNTSAVLDQVQESLARANITEGTVGIPNAINVYFENLATTNHPNILGFKYNILKLAGNSAGDPSIYQKRAVGFDDITQSSSIAVVSGDVGIFASTQAINNNVSISNSDKTLNVFKRVTPVGTNLEIDPDTWNVLGQNATINWLKDTQILGANRGEQTISDSLQGVSGTDKYYQLKSDASSDFEYVGSSGNTSTSPTIKLKSGVAIPGDSYAQVNLDHILFPVTGSQVNYADVIDQSNDAASSSVYHTAHVGSANSPAGHGSGTVNTTNNTVLLEETPVANQTLAFTFGGSGGSGGPYWTINGSDRSGVTWTGNSNQPPLKMYLGDTLTFDFTSITQTNYDGSYVCFIKTEWGGGPTEYLATGVTGNGTRNISFTPTAPGIYYYVNQKEWRNSGLIHVASKDDAITLSTGQMVGVAQLFSTQAMPPGDFANSYDNNMIPAREFYIRNWYEMEGNDEDYAGIVSFHTTKSGAEDANSNQTDIVSITGLAGGYSSDEVGLRITPAVPVRRTLSIIDKPDLTTSFASFGGGIKAHDGGPTTTGAGGTAGTGNGFSVTEKTYGTLSVSGSGTNNDEYHIYIYGKQGVDGDSSYWATYIAIGTVQIIDANGNTVSSLGPNTNNWETITYTGTTTNFNIMNVEKTPASLAASFNNSATSGRTDGFSGGAIALGTGSAQRTWNLKNGGASGSTGTGPNNGHNYPTNTPMTLGHTVYAQTSTNGAYLLCEQSSSSNASTSAGAYAQTYKYMRSKNTYTVPAGGSIRVSYYLGIGDIIFERNDFNKNTMFGVALYPS
jgi:hypothetical protein